MECHQSDSLLQRTNLQPMVPSPFLGTSANLPPQIIPMAMGGDLGSNGVSFSVCNPFLHPSPVTGGEGMATSLGSAMAMPNPDGSHVAPLTCTGLSGQMRRKHRHDDQTYVYPSKRRKVSTTPVAEPCSSNHYSEASPQPYWDALHSQAMPAPVVAAPCGQPSEIPTTPTEDMEEATIDSHSDSALQRMRDIESRLVEEEDDDGDEENTNGHLPTLVMSEVLLESLKKGKGLDELLTKKIVDSINRPSMELVLWKPQPELLIDKLHSFTSSCKDKPKVSKRAQKVSERAFLQQVEPLEEDKPQSLTVDCGIDPIWARGEEEEMEL